MRGAEYGESAKRVSADGMKHWTIMSAEASERDDSGKGHSTPE